MNKKLTGIALALVCLLAFGACKPKQSAYKSVYEAAKEREMEESAANENQPYTSPQSTTSSMYTSAPVKVEKVTPVTSTDEAGLKSYSIVVAAMSMKPNAESLKKRLQADGYDVILVQNEQGMYRVIIASYDDKDQAMAKKDEILSSFLAIGSSDTLRQKYGIPFNDWWILQRGY